MDSAIYYGLAVAAAMVAIFALGMKAVKWVAKDDIKNRPLTDEEVLRSFSYTKDEM